MKPVAGSHKQLKAGLNGLKTQAIFHNARTRPLWLVSLAALV